jgi:hypothetical protein
VLRHDSPIVGTDDLRLGELRAELVEQHRGRDATDRKLPGPVEEAAAIDRALHVRIQENQKLLVEIVSSLAFHVRLLAEE